jgi:acetyltransferase-like isoleucine patch superfamily enzyme
MGGASIAGKVKIGNFVNIGTNSTILPGLTIEDGAFIGAGAIVTKNVKKNQIVFGNPAKFIKKFSHEYSLQEFINI